MAERSFRTPSSDDVIAALERTGFLLEQRVAQQLRSMGFGVQTGRAFKDPDEGKSREVDVYASMGIFHQSRGDVRLVVKLIVECKKSSGPYVVLGRAPTDAERFRPPYAHTMPLERVRRDSLDAEGRVIMRIEKQWNSLGLHDLPGGPGKATKRGVQLVRMNLRGKEWQADNASIFESLTIPLMKAVDAFRPPRDTRSPQPSWSHMELCFPVVVTTGDLFYVDVDSSDPSADQVEWVTIERDVSAEGLQGNFTMDVVNYGSLEAYVEQVLKFAEEVRRVVAKDPDVLALRASYPY